MKKTFILIGVAIAMFGTYLWWKAKQPVTSNTNNATSGGSFFQTLLAKFQTTATTNATDTANQTVAGLLASGEHSISTWFSGLTGNSNTAGTSGVVATGNGSNSSTVDSSYDPNAENDLMDA